MEKYKITKSIRFKLEPKNIPCIKQDIKDLTSNNDFNLVDFISDLKNFIKDIKEYLFYQKKDKKRYVKDNMVIKREWLRQYTKQELIDFFEKQQNPLTNNRRRQQITIGDISGLSLKIEEKISKVDEIFAELTNDSCKDLNERSRKAQTGLLLKRLSANNALPFLTSLIDNTSDKDETNDLSICLKRQSLKINSWLLAGIQVYLPEQSNGLPVAKASFNYYTINKKPVDFKQKTKEQTDRLRIELNEGIKSLKSYFANNHFNYNQVNNILKDIYANIVNQLKDNQPLLLGDVPMLNIDNYASLRQILKNVKANQKKTFSEFMQKENSSYQELKNRSDLYLFKDISEADFDEYKQKTEETEKKGTEINQCTNDTQKKKLQSDLQRLKRERGAFINAADKNQKSKFKTYKAFANFYRSVSQKHGKILATLKGIEKEQTESQMLKYWALIVKENKQHKLILIPKENAGVCKKWLENKYSIESNDRPVLFWFESFTLRSLRKLCFGYVENGTNVFYKELSNSVELNKYKVNGKFIQGEFAFEGDDQKKIKFYKDVLASNYAQKVLKIPINQLKEEIINKEFENIDDFQIALEKICYLRHIVCPHDIVNKLNEYDAQIFEITSLDLKNTDKSNLKEHSKIWKYFWHNENEKQNFDIRLNPEITITYRSPKQSRIDKYGKGTKYYDENKNNRYLHHQYTLVTTISEHSNAPTKTLSFVTDDEFKKSVAIFNNKLKKEAVKFAFGIDNGIAELSTLGIYLPAFQKTDNTAKINELKKVSEYGFKVLSINDLLYSEKDTNGKERKIIQNPSYFLNKEIYRRTFGRSDAEYNAMFLQQFEEKHLLTLDLTTAKVINGQIITNGDIPSHFNLRMRNAQRLVYDMNDHSQKETAKKVVLKTNQTITDIEKRKFVESILSPRNFQDKYDKSVQDKYISYLFGTYQPNSCEKKLFDGIKNSQSRVSRYDSNTLFAVIYIKDEIQSVNDVFNIRDVFQLRKYYSAIMSEKEILLDIGKFNTRNMSNEELDLKINRLKQSIVANAIGVIDLLYKQYKNRYNGDGLIIKEGFNTKMVADKLEEFSGNIYRILERKLYQKFQNYGLVPPIKNLLSVRDEGINDDKKSDIIRLGNIGFVSQAGTSKNCPVCDGKIEHDTKPCNNCGFDCNGIMHSNDGIAGYNIAKRGFENFFNHKIT